MYPEFTFEVIPVAIGATGLVRKQLSTDLEKIGIERSRTGKSGPSPENSAFWECTDY